MYVVFTNHSKHVARLFPPLQALDLLRIPNLNYYCSKITRNTRTLFILINSLVIPPLPQLNLCPKYLFVSLQIQTSYL